MANLLTTPVINPAGLFTRAEALAQGFTDRDLRGFRRVLQGVYCDHETVLTHTLHCQAAAMVLPPDAVITGVSAATLHGVALARSSDRVEVLVSGHKYVNRRYGLRCWSVRSWPTEHV